MELANRVPTDLGLISLDQEKAFDRVDHGYLFNTLTNFGFGEHFMKSVNFCVVKVRGGVAGPIELGPGVRQGCALSVQLYALSIEPLLQLIRICLRPGTTFTFGLFILGPKYTFDQRFRSCLINFVFAQAKLAIWLTRRNRIRGHGLTEPDLLLKSLISARVKLDFAYFNSVTDHMTYETMCLSWCSITEEGCAALASALKLNPSHLRELNLNYNNPGESGVKLLSDLLKDPHCKLEKLHVYSTFDVKEPVLQQGTNTSAEPPADRYTKRLKSNIASGKLELCRSPQSLTGNFFLVDKD
ncbi:hypothetical protein NFI96_007412 [Prochilodus magdalenae]|nr:hypothetical protein NFI96_007412 [Prochilodus magdalenae]